MVYWLSVVGFILYVSPLIAVLIYSIYVGIENIKKINSDVNIDIREVNDVNYLDRFLKDCFKFKRKNLRNNLNGYEISKISDILNKYGYDLNVRAEDISIDIFIDIVNELCK